MGLTGNVVLTCVLGLFIVVLLEPIVYSLSNPFLELPGHASALVGGTVNLTWLTSYNESNIAWCYWDYSDCSTDPDTVSRITECPPDEFIGYLYETKARQNISSRHEGWTFLNKFSPCEGGLRGNILGHKHGGWYRMHIYTSANVMDESIPLIKRTSKYSELHVYNKVKLQASIQIGDMSVSQIQLRHARNGLIELDTQTLKNRSVSLKVWNIFPPETKVTIKRHEFGLDQVNLYIEQCTGNPKKSCNVNIIEEKTDVVYVFELDTGIQGYPIVSINQRCMFKKADPEDDGDPLSSSSTPEKYSKGVVLSLSVIIGLLVVGLIVLAAVMISQKRKKRMTLCCKGNEPKEEETDQGKSHVNGEVPSIPEKSDQTTGLMVETSINESNHT